MLDEIDVRVVDQVRRLQQVVQDIEVLVDQVVVRVGADPHAALGAQHRLVHHRSEIRGLQRDVRRVPGASGHPLASVSITLRRQPAAYSTGPSAPSQVQLS